jgi:light-regulated signal transduction histidine kinase (bacteriophytochrome)
MTFAVGLGLLALGLMLAHVVSRGIVRPIAILTNLASEPDGITEATPVATGLRETDAVAKALLTGVRQRNAVAAELARYTRELEAKNNELESFAYIASHDLKAPLRAIGHLAGWIGEDIAATANPDAMANLTLLQARVARLQMLLDGLLVYSRVGHTQTPVEDVDVAAVVHDIVTILSPPPGFSVTCEGEMPVIRTRLMPIHVVLTNLISNAIKHHDRSAGSVTVAMQVTGGVAEFRVSDDGPGISPQFHDRIFGIFQTLASRDETETSGIGLAIVKKKVQLNGGEIHVESVPPARGTTFAFTWTIEPR